MKTIEQKKAELLDDLVPLLNLLRNGDDSQRTWIGVDLVVVNYNEICAEPTLSDNPFIHDVFSGRLVNQIQDCWYALTGNVRTDLHLSECPELGEMKDYCRRFGHVSIAEYKEVMWKYKFDSKVV